MFLNYVQIHIQILIRFTLCFNILVAARVITAHPTGKTEDSEGTQLMRSKRPGGSEGEPPPLCIWKCNVN